MTEEPKAELFGNWDSPGMAELSGVKKRVMEWLEGEDFEDAELSRGIRSEVKALMLYRDLQNAQLNMICNRLREARPAGEELAVPVNDYEAGWRAGKLAAYSDALQQVADAFNVPTRAVSG